MCVFGPLFCRWDKGLYESVKHGRPFLHRENFTHPWQGFRAAVGQRVLSYGLYFPIQVCKFELCINM
jgi:hypothetical protein